MMTTVSDSLMSRFFASARIPWYFLSREMIRSVTFFEIPIFSPWAPGDWRGCFYCSSLLPGADDAVLSVDVYVALSVDELIASSPSVIGPIHRRWLA